jgi:NAD-dependent DNA ligase
MRSTTRQRKVLQFFEIPDWENKSAEEASNLINAIFANPESENLYDRYIYLTQDFDRDSDQLKPFTMEEILAVDIPRGWDRRSHQKVADAGRISKFVAEEGMFCSPPPEIDWVDSVFVLTGRFTFGTKKACEQAIVAKGGEVHDKVSTQTDYLVVGQKGNLAYSNPEQGYGGKVKEAIKFRSDRGKPRIIEESHWTGSL